MGRSREKGGECRARCGNRGIGRDAVNGAGGLYTIDGQTNHTTMDIHIVRGNADQGFDVIKSFPQQPPRDTQLVCNLIENPNDTTQYEVEVQ